jgi:hypothetical protein
VIPGIPWLKIGIAAIISAGIGLAYLNFTHLQDSVAGLTGELVQERALREQDRAAFEAAQAGQLRAIEKMQAQAVADAVTLATHTLRMEQIAAERDRAHAELDRWRKTLDAETLKRPDVVARAARIAINGSMRRAADLTAAGGGDGDDARRQDGAADPAAAARGATGAGDPARSGDAGGDAPVER